MRHPEMVALGLHYGAAIAGRLAGDDLPAITDHLAAEGAPGGS